MATTAVSGVGLSAAGRATALPPRYGTYERIVPEIFRPAPVPRHHSEAIVIGSGFGGAVSALRLAESGIQTTVLERGSRWPHDPRRAIFGFDGRMMWHVHRSIAEGALDSTLAGPAYTQTLASAAVIDDFGGIFEFSWHRNAAILCGAAVGGGSVVYLGITVASERIPFDEVFAGTVDYDEMVRVWYPKALAGLAASVMPEEVYRDRAFRNHRDFVGLATRAGYRPRAVAGNWRWNVVRDEIAGRAVPMATTGAIANSNGSLNSLDFSYLRRAEATGNATIHPRHQVNGIHVERSGRYVLDVDYVSPYGDILARRTLTTDRLVVAAGCLGTNRLLVAARDTGALPNLNEHIGTGWGNNGAGTIEVEIGGARTPQPSIGGQGFFDTDGPYARAVVNGTASQGPLDALTAATSESVIKMGITSVDHSRGAFTYRRDTGRVILDWPAAGHTDVVANCLRIGRRLAERSNLPVNGVVYERDTTWAHCMGGATLGTACDEYGRVKGYRNLYVNDGAMMPGSAGASNPSLTITAVAERNMAAIIAAGG
ncbi:GMC oxidoreductase [Gordonia sp. VNK1]|uniref:GMC oxidoreductase n=1 Tax=Gordonia oleivorans TaxID=3156618 RepID=UPI0032B43BD2